MNATDLNNKAITFYNQKQYKDAQTYFKKAIELNPKYAEAYANLGALYAKFKDYENAIKLYQECIKIKPSYAGAYTNLGNALNKTNRHEEAVYFHKMAIALDNKSANHFSNCASAYKNLGRFNKAKEYYIKAIRLEPKHVNAHFDLATVLLQTGEYLAGFKEYEWRFKKEEMQGHLQQYKNIFTIPVYKGQKLNGQSVLIHAEQGFGDSIMVARYLHVVKERGAKVIVYLRKELKSLFESLDCVDEVISRDEDAPQTDFQLPMMSLPIICDPTLDSLHVGYPYFTCSEKFEIDSDKMKIGIVWGASNTGESYKNKVFDLRHFQKLSKNPKVALYSLQLGEDSADISKYNMQDDIVDLSENIKDFLDTVKIINSLDLVITSDTSVAHLAGAMGAKVWIVLQKVPDWRWGVDSEVSEWYPSARLFRQNSLGDFNSVFRQIYKALDV